MRTLLIACLLAFLGALLIAFQYKPRPLETQLLHLQVRQAMPELANELADEAAEIQALLLAYADDPVLLAKARLALLRYADMARPVLLMFGKSRCFRTRCAVMAKMSCCPFIISSATKSLLWT